MKKLLISALLLTVCMTSINAQKFFTRTGTISFYSEAPLEKIEAVNNKVTSVIDFESNRMEFAVLIKAFQFEKSLMQEHFNENYMESSKFPKAIFKGTIEGLSIENIKEDGEYTVKVKGDLTIHGVTQPVETEGIFSIEEGKISGNASFDVQVADYKVEIPAVVKDNIAKNVKITVQTNYDELKG